MSEETPDWVERAADLPVAFAMVREDPLIDRWVVERLPGGARVLVIASGGCTAALLATSASVAALHMVDPNPAQLALARLKLALLASSPADRLALLGHVPMPAALRQQRIAAELADLGLSTDALGPPACVATVGPDQAGRYERVFAALRHDLSRHAGELDALLALKDPAEQERRVAPAAPLGRALDEAMGRVLSLPNLVRLFGEEATRNRVEPFARHFARRVRHVLATLPAAINPYLWQMLAGRYPPGHPAPWLAVPTPHRTAEITWTHGFVADALRAAPGSFDLVHLSNVLDWLPPPRAAETLENAWRALAPGGRVLVRQLNSTLEIPRLGPMFDWLGPEAAMLHARDRSFFYRALHLGRRR